MTTITVRTSPNVTGAAVKLMNKIAARVGGVVIIKRGYVRVITRWTK